MNIAAGAALLWVFLYTAGFSFSLWKEKNRLGSMAVFFLAALIGVVPFFTIFK